MQAKNDNDYENDYASRPWDLGTLGPWDLGLIRQLEDDIMLAYNSADFFEFAAEASLYKTHIKMCTTSFSA